MRAAAFAPEVARLLGVRVGAHAHARLGAGLGRRARWPGVLVAPSVFVAPNAFDAVLVFGFTAAVIGGLDSPLGAVVGGLGRSASPLSYVSGYAGGELVTLGALVILVAVLMVRPERPVRARPRRGGSDDALALHRRGPLRAARWPAPALAVLGALAAAGLLTERSAPYRRPRSSRRSAYYVVAVAGLTVLTGLNGQISLGPRRADGGRRLHGGAAARATTARWPLAVVLAAPRRSSPRSSGLSSGAAAARLRGPYLAGATLALAVGLPGARDASFSGFLGGDQRPDRVAADRRRRRSGATFPLERWQAWIACLAALDRLRAARQPRAQPARPRVPGGARRRGRRAARRASRRAARRCSRSSSAPPAPGSPAGCSWSSPRSPRPGAFPLACRSPC